VANEITGQRDMTGLVAETRPGTLIGVGADIRSKLDGGERGRRPHEVFQIRLELGESILVNLDCPPESCAALVFYPLDAPEQKISAYVTILPPSGTFQASIRGSYNIQVQALERDVEYSLSITRA
jgi:hypothetical protein